MRLAFPVAIVLAAAHGALVYATGGDVHYFTTWALIIEATYYVLLAIALSSSRMHKFLGFVLCWMTLPVVQMAAAVWLVVMSIARRDTELPLDLLQQYGDGEPWNEFAGALLIANEALHTLPVFLAVCHWLAMRPDILRAMQWSRITFIVEILKGLIYVAPFVVYTAALGYGTRYGDVSTTVDFAAVVLVAGGLVLSVDILSLSSGEPPDSNSAADLDKRNKDI